MNASKVFIAIPTLDAYVHARLIQSLISQLDSNPFAILAGVTPVAKARNMLVKDFLKTDATHIWFIDADTIPPTDALEKLLALDVPIASGITPTIQGSDIILNIYKETKDSLEAYPRDAVLPDADRMTVAAVGSSCILIKREVFEKLGESPWYFDLWSQDDRYSSEDINFCTQVKEAGYTITVHPKVMCKHARNVVI